jgi:hypothetical protein
MKKYPDQLVAVRDGRVIASAYCLRDFIKLLKERGFEPTEVWTHSFLTAPVLVLLRYAARLNRLVRGSFRRWEFCSSCRGSVAPPSSVIMPPLPAVSDDAGWVADGDASVPARQGAEADS